MSLYIEEDVGIQEGAQKMFLTYPAFQRHMTHHKEDLWSSREKQSTGLFMLEKNKVWELRLDIYDYLYLEIACKGKKELITKRTNQIPKHR